MGNEPFKPFDTLLDLFQEPLAITLRIATGLTPLPDDLNELSDESLRFAHMMEKAASLGDEVAGAGPTIVAAMANEAAKRGLLDPQLGQWATETSDTISTSYELLQELITAQVPPRSIDAIDAAIHALQPLPEEGPPSSLLHLSHLHAELHEQRVSALIHHGRDEEAEAAFDEAFDAAKIADRFAKDQGYFRRMLLKKVNWLSKQSADAPLRLLLPLVQPQLDGAKVDTQSLALVRTLAEFFQRFGDQHEARTRFEQLEDQLHSMGAPPLAQPPHNETMAQWGKCIRNHEASTVERYRLLNEIIVSWIAIEANRSRQQGEAGQIASLRMAELIQLNDHKNAVSPEIAKSEAQWLSERFDWSMPDMGPAREPPGEQVRRFLAIMGEDAQGPQTPEQQEQLLEFVKDRTAPGEFRARGMIHLAKTALDAGDIDEAKNRYGSAGTLAREASANDAMIAAWEGLALVAFMEKDFGRASSICGAAIAHIEEMRSNVNEPYLASAFMQDKAMIYQLGVEAARRDEDTATSLARMDLLKARALRAQPGCVPAATRLKAFAALEDARTHIGSANNPGNSASELAAARRAIWQSMVLSSVPEPRALDLERLQGRLVDSDVVLNYFFLADEILIANLITSTSVQTAQIRLGEETKFYTDLEKIEAASHQTRGLGFHFKRLGKLLIPEVFDDALERTQQIIVCPHQVLHSIPFLALEWRKAPLIENFAVGHIPSLTSLSMDQYSSKAKDFAGIATRNSSDGTKALKPLDKVEKELTDIARSWTTKRVNAHTLTGAEATRSQVFSTEFREKMAQARFLHLGTHGNDLASQDLADVPMESGLALVDGMADGLDLSTLELDADLVFLGACHSGKRSTSARGMERLPADSVYGLQAAFHMAGAKAMIGGQWILDDVTASKVAQFFYAAIMQGKTIAQALREALNTYRKGAGPIWDEPGYWAPFGLIAFEGTAFGISDE